MCAAATSVPLWTFLNGNVDVADFGLLHVQYIVKCSFMLSTCKWYYHMR